MGGYEVASLASRFAGQDTNEVASICSTGDTEIRRLLSKLSLVEHSAEAVHP
jgi:hypothetical protein